MTKYIFVTGGVVSGLGKGITAASLGRLLKNRGLKVTSQKLDPYMNIDPGTMSPLQHGEVFVTEDGSETDLDLGHYERFIDENLNKYSNLTSGKVYWNVLNKERKGEYLGSTVQIIPQVTDEIKEFIYKASEQTNADVIISEIGGTVGDIESQPFLEAIRQIGQEVGPKNRLYIHVTLVPYLASSKEHKSKPTQHSVKQMQALGLNPDIIVMRSDFDIEQPIKDKISLFCNVDKECVIENKTLSSLYEVPLMLKNQNFDKIVCKHLALPDADCQMLKWEALINNIKETKETVKIGLVGKYIALHDAYLSIVESLSHAGYAQLKKVEIVWVDSEELINEEITAEKLKTCQGIIVPGGFGDRGIEGMIQATRWARVNKRPFLGICLGMQVAVIEFSRDVANLAEANSIEFNPETPDPVINLMEDQIGKDKGGTMRLGSYPCSVEDNTILKESYQTEEIHERHRHRYEFNNNYRTLLRKSGLVFSGHSPDNRLIEAVELKKENHPFFIGVQFHPEFKSRPIKPQPLFLELVKQSSKQTI